MIFYCCLGGGPGVQISLSVSQSQYQHQQSSSNKDELKRLLLKLWIKKRLEQLRSNSTTPSPSTQSPVIVTPVRPVQPGVDLPQNSISAASDQTTPSPCPAIYSGDPEEPLLCSLWSILQRLQSSLGPTTFIMSSGFPAVLCQHRANPTSATELCQLWCEIQLYSGAQCASCPSKYIGQPEESLLCGLWAQLIELGNAATP